MSHKINVLHRIRALIRDEGRSRSGCRKVERMENIFVMTSPNRHLHDRDVAHSSALLASPPLPT